MHEQDKAIVKSLIAVAWADGNISSEEREMIEALLSAYAATEEEANDVHAFAAEPRSLDDIPLTDLSADDRRLLLNHAVVLTHIDGAQAVSERELITKLAERLRIGESELQQIVEAGEARAKRLLEAR